MPHLRDRHASAVIKKDLSHIPCIGILGMRQTGKSTLLKHFCKTYHSFDSQDLAFQFSQNPSLLCKGAAPIAIDEIQKVPSAFDEIKYDIDQKKRPGKYIISGSVRFSSKKNIRESLTGRISLIEVYPMTLSESHQKPSSLFLKTILETGGNQWESILQKKSWASLQQMQHYLFAGGLPGICFKRDANLRAGQFENHLETLLRHDIHMIYQTQIPFDRARLFLAEIAKSQGLPMNVAHFARLARLSQPTAKKLILALEGIFLVRSHGSTYYLEDSGLAAHLNPNFQNQMRFGDWQQLLFHELRVQLAYDLRYQSSMIQHTTRAGSEIPFVVKTKTGKTLPITIELGETASSKNRKAMTWFMKKHPNSLGIIFTFSNQPQQLGESLFELPITWVF